MKSLPERIMGYADAKPEATPIQAEDLLHLGDRAAVSRALSRLARSERLLRICAVASTCVRSRPASASGPRAVRRCSPPCPNSWTRPSSRTTARRPTGLG